MQEITKQAFREFYCETIYFNDGPDTMQILYVCGQKHGGSNP